MGDGVEEVIEMMGDDYEACSMPEWKSERFGWRLGNCGLVVDSKAGDETIWRLGISRQLRAHRSNLRA